MSPIFNNNNGSSTSNTRQITIKEGSAAKVSKKAIAMLQGVFAFGVFMVGFDQGEVFGLTVPADGSCSGGGDQQQHPTNNWAHEFYHDMRHAAGFPCH